MCDQVEHLEPTEDGCDACHMSGRRSRFRVQLEGYPYNRETHEPLESEEEKEKAKKSRRVALASDSDSDGSESGSGSSEASGAKSLPRNFFMGTFCKRRAEVFHAMSHWGWFNVPFGETDVFILTFALEYHLFHRVRGYYRDLLRAKFQAVQSDSETSSEGSTPREEERLDRIRRRTARARRRLITEKRIKRLRDRGGLVERHGDEDRVTEWMDSLGHQDKVGDRNLARDWAKGKTRQDYRWLAEVIRQSEMLEFDRSKDE